MSLQDIVQVNISTTGVLPTQPGFGVPLILGVCTAWGVSTDRIRYYTGTAGMVSDGFLTTDPEYIAAAAMFAQNPAPPRIAVGRRALKPTMVFKIKVLQAVNGKRYSVFVNGVEKFFTAGGGDTPTSIATGLAAAIGTPSGFLAATSAVDVVTLTAAAAGNWLRVSVNGYNTDLDNWQDHADPGVQTDLNAISVVDNTWYAIVSTFAGTTGGTNTSEVGQIATWAESHTKLYLADVQDSTILGAGALDIGSKLKALSYARTAPLYHPDNGMFAAGAWAGKCLPFDPGSEDWKFKLLAGVTTVALTDTQAQNADGKNVNTYQLISGVGTTGEGVVADREFIDVIRFRDWLAATMSVDIFTALTQSKKIPYTDEGAAVIETQVRQRLEVGVTVGGIARDPAYTVTVPKVATQSTADRQSRKMRNITWTAQLAGSIHSLVISGTVTV
jgi:hypothetical protein